MNTNNNIKVNTNDEIPDLKTNKQNPDRDDKDDDDDDDNPGANGLFDDDNNNDDIYVRLCVWFERMWLW